MDGATIIDVPMQVPCSPYLGPDPDSPMLDARHTHFAKRVPNSFVVTAGKPGAPGLAGRKRVSVVGGYKLGRTLGKGSCGVVKLGTHLESGKKVAIKVLKPKNDREKHEIQREIAALQQLSHPNIIRLLDVIYGADLVSSSSAADTVSDDTEVSPQCLEKYIFMVMELATGGELFEKVLHGGPLHEEEARRCFRQILGALTHTHAHLICHRDLKPENILFDADGNVKISDFGLSNVAQPGRLFGTWCGSPMYAPPEVVMEQKYKGWAVDVWSLGIILYVMVTGGMPWRLERGQVRDMELFLAGEYQVPDDMGISDECRDLLDRMIQPNPANRACLREMCTHPWITNNGALAPPETYLNIPEHIPTTTRPDGRIVIDEDLLFQVQETVGLDLVGMFEARSSIQARVASPALTAYTKLAHRRSMLNGGSVSLHVSDQNMPAYMTRHRRNRSEIPRSRAVTDAAVTARQAVEALPSPKSSTILASSVGMPSSPVAHVQVQASVQTQTTTVTVSAERPPLVDEDVSPFSPSTRRARAGTSPAAYNSIALHKLNTQQEVDGATPFVGGQSQTPRFDPVCYDPHAERKTRREAKQSATRHMFRTLLLKIKWGKK
eukprot:TRINITY_DN8275_c0_g1_i5.p1 TRINITY_DN8275_c0_g1~~TRINITY_DN8275_c0_g1_i5.p1  ORF type:complete len:608 (-),score=154.57 TRINITY_DN8275_c0_g1_i5:146-1969(-)